MEILLDRTGSVGSLADSLARLDADAAVEGILVFACDGNGFRPEDVDPVLRAVRKPLFGGVFPQIVHGSEHLLRGTVAVGLKVRPALAVVHGVSRPEQDFDEVLLGAFPGAASDVARTMFVFVDGFASRVSALIDALFNTFGLEVNYIGGGAGSLSLVPGPCVITPEGLVQDAAVVALLDVPSGVGVAHGWHAVSDAFKVTESEGNVIHSLDWRPALEVYREVVEAHANDRLDAGDFFRLAKAYPFGITKLGNEMVVRDPLMPRGDGLVCVGEVPQGSFVRVLHGDEQSLLGAASHAREMAAAAMGARPVNAQFFIDCISRVLFLEDRFAHELGAVRTQGVPMVGALTIGEIANSGRDYLEFYNKTAVVGLL